MTVSLRVAGSDDLSEVGELHHRSRLHAYAGVVPDDALAQLSGSMMSAWWTERWGYERDTHVLTVAERQGRLAGFSYVGPDEDLEPDTGLLCAIHLDPAQQGRGTGRLLMIEALATMQGQGWRRAALWVLAGNDRARRFYERGGWLPTGQARDSRFGSPVRELRYARSLP